MNKKIKKLIMGTVVASMFSATIGVHAAEINIGSIDTEYPRVFEDGSVVYDPMNDTFNNLVMIRDNVTYLPIRLIFTSINEQVQQRFGMSIVLDANDKYNNFRIILRKYEIAEDGTKILSDIYKSVQVGWRGGLDNNLEDIMYFTTYRLIDPNGPDRAFNRINIDFQPVENIDIKFDTLEDGIGQRAFMSTEDINKIIEFLIGDNTYDVILEEPVTE